MAHHTLDAGPDTCRWGYVDAALPPVLTVQSGDSVTIQSVSGTPETLPPAGMTVPPALLDIHAKVTDRTVPGHIVTGPVAVAGAEPGDMLEVRIEAIELGADWGYNRIHPLSGTLIDDNYEPRLIHIPLDSKRMIGTLPWGLELPLKPFFGVMGVAPPPSWGRISTIEPRAMGGNLDNKELVAGSTLFLPVFTPGAMFSCGDGHGAQGDGEVCVTAIETALTGTFSFHLHKGAGLCYPRAETPTHYITMSMHPSLDVCAERALKDMIVLLGEKGGLSRHDAYTLCSLAADLRVTQTVNRSKGVHCMIEKKLVG